MAGTRILAAAGVFPEEKEGGRTLWGVEEPQHSALSTTNSVFKRPVEQVLFSEKISKILLLQKSCRRVRMSIL